MFAFDDPSTGLIREPFIGGANYHLDKFAGNQNSCLIAFSKNTIPEYDVKLRLGDTDLESGSNYYDEDNRLVWLCPVENSLLKALFNRLWQQSQSNNFRLY